MNTHSRRHADNRKRTTEIFRDVGKLLIRCAGYWKDLQDGENGWKIHYAIDADVIVTYMDPSKNLGRSMLFSRDEHLAEIVARMNSDFVLRDLQGSPNDRTTNGSLLVISPHDEEFHLRLTRLQYQVTTHTKHIREQLKRVLDLIRNNAADEEIAKELIENAADLLYAAGGGRSPIEAIERFAALDAQRLLNILKYRFAGSDGSFEFPAPPTDASHPEFERFAGMFGAWKKALKRHAPQRKSSRNIYNDARVLATLEWINERIRPDKHRLVLITGSKNIFSAAEADDKPYPVATVADDEKFANLYLRHPHAFMSDRKFFAQPGNLDHSADFRLFDWLNLFFPTVIDKRTQGAYVRRNMLNEAVSMPLKKWKVLAQELRRAFVKPNKRTAESFPASLVDRWEEQMRGIAVEKGIADADKHPESVVHKVVTWLRENSDNAERFEHFIDHLNRRVVRSLARLYQSTAFLGEFALRDEHSKIFGVPSLRFDDFFVDVQHVCNRMQDSMFEGVVTFDLGALYRDHRTADPECYHPLLVHALAFAIRGHWSATQTLCQVALEIAQGIPRSIDEKRTGREAAYLLSVAQRRLADKPADMQEARRNLQLARTLEPATADDLRFDGEQLANEVVEYMLRRSHTKISMSAAEVVVSLEDKLARTRQILERLSSEPLPHVSFWVKRQLFANVVGFALIAELDHPGSSQKHLAELREMIELLHRERLAPDSSEGFRDMFSDVIYWAALSVFEIDPARRAVGAAQLREIKPAEFGYNEARIREICEFGIRHSSNSERSKTL